MAEVHAVSKDNKHSLFKAFDKLLDGKGQHDKACVFLLDAVKNESNDSESSRRYAAKRLVRGLASSTLERQTVMYAALTAALTAGVFSIQEVLEALESETASNSDQSSFTMIILAYESIAKCGKMFQLPADKQVDILQKMLTTGKRKQYLKNAVVIFLADLIEELPKSLFKKFVWPSVKEEMGVDSASNNETPFIVLFLITTLKYPKLTEKTLQSQFGDLKSLFLHVLRICPHFPETLQDIVLNAVSASNGLSSKQWLNTWKAFVENEKKPTPSREVFTLKLAKKLLTILTDPSLIPQLLRPELISLILRSRLIIDKAYRNEFSFIESGILLDLIVSRLEDVQDDVKLQVIRKLLFYPGSLQFDARTKSKTSQLLISKLKEDGIKFLAEECIEIIKGGRKKQEEGDLTRDWSYKEKQTVLILLSKLLMHPASVRQSGFVLENLQFVINVAFLKSDIEVNLELRKCARDIFFKIVEFRNYKIDDAVNLLNDVVEYLNNNIDSAEVNEAVLESWNAMRSASEKMKRKTGDKTYAAVRLLLMHMGLMLFRDPDLASSTIQELLQCYNRLRKERDAKRRASVVSDDEPKWVEVTVDLLLAMLSRENKLLRHLVSAVFPSMAPHLTPTALQQIIDALDPAARNDVLKHIDSDDSDEEESEDDNDDDVDGEEESAGSAVEEEGDEVGQETVNDKLRMAVRNALGYSAALTDDESVDMDDMNEEEERKLNENLASAFSLFRSGKTSKKKQSKDDEAQTHFRIRVLDLVEIIISSTPSLASCLDMLPPLFALLEFSIKDQHQKPLQNRLETVLKKLGSLKKFSDVTSVSYCDVVTMLKVLMNRDVSGLVYVEMAPILTECCVLLVRASQLLSAEGKPSMEEAFVNLLDKHFLGNDRKVPYSLFQSILRMLWNGNWKIVNRIMTLLLEPDMKLFKKQKLVDLLEIFYKNDRLHSTATDDIKTVACAAEVEFAKKFAELLSVYNQRQKGCKVLAAFYTKLVPILQLAIARQEKFNLGSSPQWAAVVEQLMLCTDLFIQQKTKSRLTRLATTCGLHIPNLQKAAVKISAPDTSDLDSVVAEATNENIKTDKVKQKSTKRKSSNEARKLKKESRELREAASAFGLQGVNFASVNLPGEVEEVQPPQKKKKGKK